MGEFVRPLRRACLVSASGLNGAYNELPQPPPSGCGFYSVIMDLNIRSYLMEQTKKNRDSAPLSLLIGANDLRVLPPRPEAISKTFDSAIIEAMERLQATVEIHRQISNRPAGA